MTTLNVIDGDRGETLTAAVARRLRGQMAERNITNIELATRTGWGRQMVSRRVHGQTALNTEEMEAIERVTGISATYLFTGRRNEESPRPDGPGDHSQVRPKGFEPLTSCTVVSQHATSGVVVPLKTTDPVDPSPRRHVA